MPGVVASSKLDKTVRDGNSGRYSSTKYPRALARSSRFPPIATSFTVITPLASACVVFPSTFASPARLSDAYPTLARSCASSRAASAAMRSDSADSAERAAAFFEARAFVSLTFALSSETFAAPAEPEASPAFLFATSSESWAFRSLRAAASTLAFTSTANSFSAGINVLFRSSLTIFSCAFKLLKVIVSNRS